MPDLVAEIGNLFRDTAHDRGDSEGVGAVGGDVSGPVEESPR
jgi:hypothetical protein